MRVRDYAGPLGVLAAGVFGFSLLCSVSALAMNDLNSQTQTTLEPLNIVDLAVANLRTPAALTQQAVTLFVSTPTLLPTVTASLTPLPSNTVTVPPSATPTPRQSTRLRRPPREAPPGPLLVQAHTPLPAPTKTPLPPPTDTEPPPTDTLSPPTNTEPPPPPTNTEPPPPPTETEPPSPAPAIEISVTTPTASP